MVRTERAIKKCQMGNPPSDTVDSRLTGSGSTRLGLIRKRIWEQNWFVITHNLFILSTSMADSNRKTLFITVCQTKQKETPGESWNKFVLCLFYLSPVWYSCQPARRWAVGCAQLACAPGPADCPSCCPSPRCLPWPSAPIRALIPPPHSPRTSHRTSTPITTHHSTINRNYWIGFVYDNSQHHSHLPLYFSKFLLNIYNITSMKRHIFLFERIGKVSLVSHGKAEKQQFSLCIYPVYNIKIYF